METSGHILFKETQRFRQAWVLTLLFATNAVALYSIYIQVIKKEVLNTELGHHSDATLVRSAVLLTIITIFMLSAKLETIIKPDGIYVRFFPLHMQYKFYPWNQMSDLYIRSYNPLTEYGGWGLRGLGKKKAYNVSGTIGLQIEFINKSTLLIGTQKAAEMKAALQQLHVGK